MTSWVKIGVKCVCIDDSPGREDHHFAQAPRPIGGKIHTISDVTYRFGRCSVQVEELPSRMRGTDGVDYEIWMDARRFRPLVEPKSEADDIKIFAPLLTVKTLEPTP